MPKILDFICLEDKFLLLKIAKSLAKCGLRPGRRASALRAKESESTTSSPLRKFQRWLGPSATLTNTSVYRQLHRFSSLSIPAFFRRVFGAGERKVLHFVPIFHQRQASCR
jgi:hypothetical protein